MLAFYGQTIYLLTISDSDHFPESLEKQQDSSSIEKRYIIVEYLHMETGVLPLKLCDGGKFSLI